MRTLEVLQQCHLGLEVSINLVCLFICVVISDLYNVKRSNPYFLLFL